MLQILQNNLIEILMTALTGILSYVGLKLKKLHENYIETKIKKEIVKSTVQYIEQIYKGILISNEDKFQKCKEKALEWLNNKKIKVSDTELEILIESAVIDLKKRKEDK